MGVYVYEQVALNYLREGACQLPELVLRLIDAGERVAAYRADEAYWFDIGTIAEHQRAAAEFERAPEKFGVAAAPDLSTTVAPVRRRRNQPRAKPGRPPTSVLK
jgi:NDP-sugar pyrophosphorylase family protein